MSAETPMRCSAAAPYLSAFVDGELTEPLHELVGQHLATCSACAAKVARYAEINRLLGQLPRTAPAPGTLDAILAATRERHGDPATRERMREGISLRDIRRRLSALDLPATPAPISMPQAQRRRNVLLAATLPTLAALLIISVALIAFNRLPRDAGFYQVSGNATPTPAPGNVTLQHTRASVATFRSQLAFDPVLPQYLPDGATLARIDIGPQGADAGARYLDIVWKLSGSVQQIHLRETPGNASVPGYSAGGMGLALSWQIGEYPWRPLLQSDARRIAVGQQRQNVSMALDVTVPSGGTVEAERVLRITALSMDQRFEPIVIAPIQTDGRVVHFKALANDRTGQPAARVEVYATSDGSESRTQVSDAAGNALYTDILSGNSGIRLDERHMVYSTLSSSERNTTITEANGPLPKLFYLATTLEQAGELWNMGQTTYNGQHVWDLRLVNAPSLTHVYVNVGSRQVVAVVADTAANIQPGGPAAEGHYASASGCLTYTFIEYLDPTRVPGKTFTTQPLPPYHEGTTPPSITC